MPFDLSESSDADIRMSYQSIIQEGSLNWLLLSYGKVRFPALSVLRSPLETRRQWSAGLKLVAAGSQGLNELKEHVTSDEVHFAFVREHVDGENFLVIVAYIPDKISGLRRARALVTSRTVQSWFKAHQGILTISHMDRLNPSSVMAAVRSPSTGGRDSRSPSRTPPPAPVHSAAPTSPSPLVSRAFSSPPNTEKALPHAPYPSVDLVRRVQSDSPPVSRFLPPEERARRRQSMQRRAVIEEREAMRAEADRQAHIKAQKAEILRRSEEEDARRRASLEEELQRRNLTRAQREAEEREAEAERVRQKEEKRRHDAERRQAEQRRIEEWRAEEEHRVEELARQEALFQELAAERLKDASAEAVREKKEKVRAGTQVLMSGWVTMQAAPSLVWKRRYFQLTSTSMKLYKSEKDMSHPLEDLNLRNALSAVNEWYEGFEDLRAIPHSFGIVFRDGKESLSMYTDSDHEKYALMGFLLTYT
ncbi:hypothetical protein FA95DRAFT_1559316 [Auriscalpium vulgare]|uniref:Uncharacterized protein n=1 Tax=Auriscalpium vulgare TaxID=40419 RepID=A0ACB8RUG8_9AGAM|nr:hypothetical protein FA95DRAFT_1559316 [Auriscalpium vulgare]